ncbi:MAG TPA: hypothetical protein VN213_19835 [Solirubrobacteraceae bacterium]|nr:hypothetical protein [Solirubrobacteraceae bacterium]
MQHTPFDSPDATLTRLARDNPQHLRWLHGQVGDAFNDEDLADVLQTAHEEATVELHKPAPPSFPDWTRAVCWFRRICSNTAMDVLRSRDGRGESARAARPRLVSLDGIVEDGEQAEPGLGVVDQRLEELMSGDAPEELRKAVEGALRRLPDEHARILYWRYHDNLEPADVMQLERITRKQYERRHLAAMKALGRALAGLEMSGGCRQTRRELRRRAAALLDPTAGAARVHVEDCVACRAFRMQLRGAFAAIPPWPAAIGAKLVLAAQARVAAADAAEAAQRGAGAWHGALAQSKLLAALATGALGLGGTGMAVANSDPVPAPIVQPAKQRAAAAEGHLTEPLGVHLAHDPLTRR